MIADRRAERERLADLLAVGAPQLVLMYGRRRVGKTFLLANAFSADTRQFYFTAADTTTGQNRTALLDAMREFTGTTLAPDDFQSWRNVFRRLMEMDGNAPLVIVLDEFQYMGDGTEQGLRDVTSQLNAVWEATRPTRPLLFVLCGSSIRLLEALNHSGSPLYGRFAWVTRLKPFNYWHAAEMAPFASLRDRAVMYCVFGGTPRYLAHIDVRQSLGDNIARLCLARDGPVRQLVETALVQEQGLREHTTYNAILRAIGAGNTELNSIQQGAAIVAADLTATRDKLERLLALGFVRKERNFGAKHTQPYRYRLDDPALAFYYTFVTRNAGILEQYDARTVFAERVEPRLNSYVGLQFEALVAQAYRRLQPGRSLPMDQEWGRWEGRDRTGASLEMDIVSRLADGRMMTGGIKWNVEPMPATWHHHHVGQLQRLAHAGHKWAHEALEPDAPLLWVAAGGFEDGVAELVRATHAQATLLTLRDLYSEA